MSAAPQRTHWSWFASPEVATWLAGLLPLCVYAMTADGHSYWLDSAEFTAAAVDLDIAHPPGHPLASLWAKTVCLLPIGPLPYRVAMAQALSAAIATSALARAFAQSLALSGVRSETLRTLLALLSAWCLAFSYGFWFQAVRAEVYALQTMLLCLALERLVAFAASDAGDLRPLYLATFYLGLGLGNHHFMSVLAVPALLYALVRALRRHGPKVLGGELACGAVGLVSYLYLPLRAQSEPAMDLGHPVTFPDFFWVVSAQVYARRIGTAAVQPLGERFADLAVILAEQFGLVSLPLALLGIYLLLRKRATRELGYVWAVTALVSLCGRAWLNPVRNNPDVLGYMMPGFAGYVALVVCGLVVLGRGLWPRAPSKLELGLVLAGSLLAALQLARTRPEASLRTFHATFDFDQSRHASTPNDAVLFVTSPETAFRHWENAATSRARPDVAMVPTAFVNYGAMADALLRRQPELGPSVRAFQRQGVLRSEALEPLAALRPVLVEPDLTASWPLFPQLIPAGYFYRFTNALPSPSELWVAAEARNATLRALTARLGAEIEQTETRRQLLFLHYIDALYYASHGEFELARRATRAGLALAPRERELLKLEATLDHAPHSFDLRAFLPGD